MSDPLAERLTYLLHDAINASGNSHSWGEVESIAAEVCGWLLSVLDDPQMVEAMHQAGMSAITQPSADVTDERAYVRAALVAVKEQLTGDNT